VSERLKVTPLAGCEEIVGLLAITAKKPTKEDRSSEVRIVRVSGGSQVLDGFADDMERGLDGKAPRCLVDAADRGVNSVETMVERIHHGLSRSSKALGSIRFPRLVLAQKVMAAMLDLNDADAGRRAVKEIIRKMQWTDKAGRILKGQVPLASHIPVLKHVFAAAAIAADVLSFRYTRSTKRYSGWYTHCDGSMGANNQGSTEDNLIQMNRWRAAYSGRDSGRRASIEKVLVAALLADIADAFERGVKSESGAYRSVVFIQNSHTAVAQEFIDYFKKAKRVPMLVVALEKRGAT
jgi:hypothetical protein